MITSIHVLLNFRAVQGKQVCILDIKNAFQNKIELNQRKRTYNAPPPFFLEYLRLHWANHPISRPWNKTLRLSLFKNDAPFKDKRMHVRIFSSSSQNTCAILAYTEASMIMASSFENKSLLKFSLPLPRMIV
jgi:hypothetical protein